MCTGNEFVDVTFIGGRSDGLRVGLQRLPPRLHIGPNDPSSMRIDMYERIDDPDTGDFLGAYIFTGSYGG